MAENFSDTQKIKQKRQNFMGAAREIREIPKTVRKKPIETDLVSVTTTPLETNIEELKAEVKKQAEPIVVKPEDKLTISKGFIVGHAEDGKVLFKPFGEVSKLEIVALAAYAKAIAADVLNELAGNDIPVIKRGMEAALLGVKALLAKGEPTTAA